MVGIQKDKLLEALKIVDISEAYNLALQQEAMNISAERAEMILNAAPQKPDFAEIDLNSTTKLPPLNKNEILSKPVLHDKYSNNHRKEKSRDFSQSVQRDKNNMTPSVLSEISEFENDRKRAGNNIFVSSSKSQSSIIPGANRTINTEGHGLEKKKMMKSGNQAMHVYKNQVNLDAKDVVLKKKLLNPH